MKNIKEFEVHVPQSKIDLLHEKIKLTRWPDELNDNKWSLGTSLEN
jgi:Epoxide hydrolase N terminus.